MYRQKQWDRKMVPKMRSRARFNKVGIASGQAKPDHKGSCYMMLYKHGSLKYHLLILYKGCRGMGMGYL